MEIMLSEAGLNAGTDAIAKEEKIHWQLKPMPTLSQSVPGKKLAKKPRVLMKALQSEKVISFIESNYQGAVVPMS